MKRFIVAQEKTYETARKEIQNGRKRTHWMWFIFPQLAGLGHSENAQFYGIKGLPEAAEYLQHPVLGTRLIELGNILLALPENNATKIFGSPDDIKLKSSMTLFSLVPQADPVFRQVLDKFFQGKRDERTITILQL